jgi:DHA2 family methylenomycin A resistance protein-like MFS transporter
MRRTPRTSSKWLVLVAACLGLGMLMIDTFVVNVAFPAIGRSMHASLSAAEWTVSGYVLAVGVLPIAMGRAGDIFGRRRIYLAGLILFLVASAASGTSQTIEQLILCRVLQGIGAATMMPGTLSIITQAFPPQQRGLAIGIWGGVSGLGLIAGPILGGLLVHGDSWRWIFYINLPIGVAAVAMTLLFVPESRDESAARSLDLAGVALLSAPLLLVMYAITRANDLGWTSPQIVGCFVGAAALVPMFIVTERRVANPLIDLTLFRSRTFVFACLSAFLFSATVFGAQPYTSLFMQNFWGFSPLKGGVAFLPSTVVVAGLMPVSGILGQRLGTKLRFFLLFAAVAVASSFILQLRLTTASGYLDGFLPSFLLRGLGIGLFMSATSYAVVSSMPVSKSGLASGTLTMSRNIGTSLGVAVFGAVFLHSIDANLPARLDGVSTQSPAVVAAAEHFVPAGDPSGGTHAIAADEIVHGFVLICGAAVVTCVLASGAAFAVRPRALEAASEVAPAALAVEADAGT